MIVRKSFTKSLNQEVLDSYSADSIDVDAEYLKATIPTSLTLSNFSINSKAAHNFADTAAVITAPSYSVTDRDATTVRVAFTLTLGTATRVVTKDLTFAKSLNQQALDDLTSANFGISDQNVVGYGIEKDTTGRADQFTSAITGVEIDSVAFVAPLMKNADGKLLKADGTPTKSEADAAIDHDATTYQAKLTVHLGQATRTITYDITTGKSFNQKLLDQLSAADFKEVTDPKVLTEPNIA